MKKIAAVVLVGMLILSMAACAGAEEKTEVQEQTQEQTQTETTIPDADWNLPETIEMPEDRSHPGAWRGHFRLSDRGQPEDQSV